MLDSLKARRASWPAWTKRDALIMGSAKLMDFLSVHFLVSKYLGSESKEASNSIVLCGWASLFFYDKGKSLLLIQVSPDFNSDRPVWASKQSGLKWLPLCFFLAWGILKLSQPTSMKLHCIFINIRSGFVCVCLYSYLITALWKKTQQILLKLMRTPAIPNPKPQGAPAKPS